ncbi:uncharacterized protein LOC101845353 [Aplysia californica]|uniref:Uncharacterized protein LOC101845353 n=1 Tax=Aplysia californica TaxID=6500 RepID=A0ABM0K0W3_APLCA|nr:uncharacterized protein LOC101845353 [Aplysia californica]
MGGCISKSSFTVTKPRGAKTRGIQPFLFSIPDAETTLIEAEVGDFLLYRDYSCEKIILSVRMHSYIRHYRIAEVNKLYHLEGQPYAYLDSIILYHQKHKLNGAKLRKQAYLSARVVRSFAHKVARTNGNQNAWTNQNGNAHNPQTLELSVPGHSRTSSHASLLTSSSASTTDKRQRL